MQGFKKIIHSKELIKESFSILIDLNDKENIDDVK